MLFRKHSVYLLRPAVVAWWDKSYYNIVSLVLVMPVWSVSSSEILFFSESKWISFEDSWWD